MKTFCGVFSKKNLLLQIASETAGDQTRKRTPDGRRFARQIYHFPQEQTGLFKRPWFRKGP